MILTANKIITGDGVSVFNKYGILIRNGIISSVAPINTLKKIYPQEQVHDYGQATILPGLIDMHLHVGFWWRQHDTGLISNFEIALIGLKQAQDAFSAGVTTIRDVSSPNHLTQTLLDYGARGYFHIPRIFHSNTGLCITGGHGYYFYGGTVEVDGIDQIVKAIRKQKKAGATWIKLMLNHANENICEFSHQELSAAVESAHYLGLHVAVHAATPKAIEAAINAGVDTIEHANYLTVEQAIRMKNKGIAWCPTVFSHETFPQTAATVELRTVQEQHLSELINTGVVIITGTDMIKETDPAAPVSREIHSLVKYGMSPLDAIKAATQNGATVLGISDQIGLLKEGYIADILIVDGDPLQDITALQQVKEVFQAGLSVYCV